MNDMNVQEPYRQGAFEEYLLFEPNVGVVPAQIKTVQCKTHHVVHEKTTNYFPVVLLVKYLLWVFGQQVTKVPSSFDIELGLKLGNLSTIAKPSKG